MKKAQGISINVIIIAAIALLVLIILAVLVLNASQRTDRGTKACVALGGKCQASCDDPAALVSEATDCSGSTPECCKLVLLE